MKKIKPKKVLAAAGLVVLFLLSFGGALAQEEIRTHTAGALDNYYSLSLKYNVSIEDLKQANPGIAIPKPGDVIIIPPAKEAGVANEEGDCRPSKGNQEQLYRVALLIPLYLEQLEDTNWSYKQDPSKIGELQPYRFIQYYHGFMMALDSLRMIGLNAEVRVYDVDQTVSKAHAVLDKPEMKKMDLIFGPFFKSTFSVVAEFAEENRIPVINPLSSRPDILDNNPYVFKLVPSVESQPEVVARLVQREFSDNRIILYVSDKYQNNDLVERYRAAIEQSDPSGNRAVTVVDYGSDSLRGFRNYASLTQPNLVIVFSESEVLPTALLGKLHALKEEYIISVIGLPEWDKFGNMESVYLMTMNTHILMPAFVDFQDSHVKGFIAKYRVLYLDEPSYYAYAGFDAAYYFLTALMNFGHGFQGCLHNVDIPLIQNQFLFEHKNGHGYDNVYWNVLQYFDYSLLKKSF